MKIIKPSNYNKVLISPMNWGLGHTTRIIPLIKVFQENGYEVHISGSEGQLKIVREFYSEIKKVNLPVFNFRFGYKRFNLMRFVWQIPVYFIHILKEHYALKALNRKYQYDIVLSDNNYGLWYKDAHCIFMTHQVHLILPNRLRLFTGIANKINRYFINKFDELWIPDTDSENSLSGKLSAITTGVRNYHYIGSLSRFSLVEYKPEDDIIIDPCDILFILSGPEPQKTDFENTVKNAAIKLSKTFSIKIINCNDLDCPNDNIKLLPYQNAKKLMMEMIMANVIVCRSGYSTIMDLLHINKKAVLIPTPGQTEQEYLADYLSFKMDFVNLRQDQVGYDKLKEAISLLIDNGYSDYTWDKTEVISQRLEVIQGLPRNDL